MSFTIFIDATTLSISSFLIPGVTPIWLAASSVVGLSFVPGTYEFAQPNGALPLARFEVNTDGSVSLPPGDSMSYSNQDRVLKLVGYPVTLDATALKNTMGTFLLENLTGWKPTDVTHPLRLMPQSYRVVQPNGVVAAAVFEVKADGSVSLPAVDFMSFSSQDRVLKLVGYPVTVDGTGLTVQRYYLKGITNSLDSTKAHPLNLLPGSYHFFQGNNVAVPEADFQVLADGMVDFQASSGSILKWSMANRTLKILGFPITLDGTGLTVRSYFLGDRITHSLDNTRPQPMNLLPGSYHFFQGNNVAVPEADFQVLANGTVDFPTSSGSILKWSMVNRTLEILGFPITLDGTGLTVRSYFLDGITTSLDSTETHPLNLLPGSYNFFQGNNFAVPDADFEVQIDGELRFEAPPAGIPGFISSPAKGSIRILGYSIEVDADQVSTFGIGLHDVVGVQGGVKKATYRLLPGPYQLRISNERVRQANFEVLLGGTVTYQEPAVGIQGFMSGKGTSSIRFTGYPIDIDATEVTAWGINIVGIDAQRKASEKYTAYLLPSSYQLAVSTGQVDGALFDVAVGGEVTAESPPNGLPGFMSVLDRTTIKFTGYPVVLDTIDITADAVNIFGTTYPTEPTQIQPLRLLPCKYEYQLAVNGERIDGALFRVHVGGGVTIEPLPQGVNGFVSVDGTTVRFAGYAVTLDATLITTRQVHLSGWRPPLTNDAPNLVRLMPRTYQVSQGGVAVSEATFTVALGGAVAAARPTYVRIDGATVRFDGIRMALDASVFAGVPLHLVETDWEIDTTASAPQEIRQFPYVALTLALATEPPRSIEFYLNETPAIELDEPYPFVQIGLHGGIPLMTLSLDALRGKRPCRWRDLGAPP